LLGLLSDPEYGGSAFLQNVELPLDYLAHIPDSITFYSHYCGTANPTQLKIELI
jgi:hypothetical protein